MTHCKSTLRLSINLGRFRRNAGRIQSGTPVVITSVPLVGFTGIRTNDQIWKEFAKCKMKMNQELSYSITYVPSVKAMNHKNITISGFILPLEAKNKFSHFLLSKNAPTCAFCPPGAPNEVVEVFSSKPLMWKEDLITFSGTLNLVNDGKTGVFFQMKDAVER